MYRKSIDSYMQLDQNLNKFHLVQPMMSLSAFLCQNGRYMDGINELEKLIELQEHLLWAEQQLKQVTIINTFYSISI
jgi:hypothetical protein